MFKPPFLISSIKGTELWPNTIQMPTSVMTILQSRRDLSPIEEAIGRGMASDQIQRVSGQLKQSFLRSRQSSNASSSAFVQYQQQITPAIKAVYVRNYSLERLVLLVDIDVLLNEPKVRDYLRPTYAVIRYKWYVGGKNGSGGSDLRYLGFAPITRLTKPFVSLPVGQMFYIRGIPYGFKTAPYYVVKDYLGNTVSSPGVDPYPPTPQSEPPYVYITEPHKEGYSAIGASPLEVQINLTALRRLYGDNANLPVEVDLWGQWKDLYYSSPNPNVKVEVEVYGGGDVNLLWEDFEDIKGVNWWYKYDNIVRKPGYLLAKTTFHKPVYCGFYGEGSDAGGTYQVRATRAERLAWVNLSLQYPTIDVTLDLNASVYVEPDFYVMPSAGTQAFMAEYFRYAFVGGGSY